VRWTADAPAALAGSTFVVTQLRVGGQEARHRDELTGREFGLIGQETTGIGGFAKALRTIPVMLGIAREVERCAPAATLVNFTNPAGLITEFLRRHSSLRVVGLCNVPWNMQIEVADALGCEFADVAIDYVGLNHLSWARGFRVGGEERTAEVLARYRELLVNRAAGEDEPGFAPETIALLGAVPNYYDIYYYETTAMLRHQERVPTRASQVMAIEAKLLERYADESLREKPKELMERGGAYYSESAAALMADVHVDAGSVQVVNVRNDGAIPNLPDDVVVEMPARIGREGATAIAAAPLRADLDALVRAAKDYELLTIEAALSGDASLARLALVTNPLGPDASLAPRVWERLRSDNHGHFGALDG
jgi:6-phospho-beta-glucosidase